MSAGRFVGRVGGLAVLLGVGISLGQGIAAADEGSPAGPSSSSSQSAHHAPRGTSAPRNTTAHKRVAAPAVRPAAKVVTPVGRAQAARVQLAPTAAAAPVIRVTLRSIATDVMGWVGFGALTPYVPLPNLPVPPPINTIWLGVRDVARRLGHPVQVAGSTSTAGMPTYTVGTADGTRAVVVTGADNWDRGIHTTRLVVMNPATGAQVGDGIVLTGAPVDPPVVTADGTRAIVTTLVYSSNDATRVTVIDLVTGTQVGSTTALYGRFVGPPVLIDDDDRVLLTTADGSSNGGTWLSKIDTSTGVQTGASVHLSATPTVLSASGSRAVVVTRDVDAATNLVTAHFAVFDTDTGDQIGTTVSLDATGDQWSTETRVVNTDDTHALLFAYDPEATHVAVLDTATGTQTGATLTLAGRFAEQVLVADGARALVVTSFGDPLESNYSMAVTLIDAATGAQISTAPVELAGSDSFVGLNGSAILLNGNGTRALVIADDPYEPTGIRQVNVAVVDTTTGAQIGSTIELRGVLFPTGSLREPTLSADGNHVLITLGDGASTRVSVVDTRTGSQTESVANLPGAVVGAAQPLTADGSRALITTNSGSDISGYQTHLSVVDTATGALIGTTLTVSGSGAGPLLSADGSRAVVVTQSYSWYTGLRTTRVAVFDTTSGEQVGKTRTLGGYANLAQVSGADGTHALVATSIWNPVTLTTSSRVLLIDTVTGHKLGALTIAGDPWLPWVSADGTRAVLATDVRYLWNLHASNTGVVVLQIA